MTDIERAKKLVRGSTADVLMRDVVLDAIDAAVKEEREACAKVAETTTFCCSPRERDAVTELRETIAIDIRGRS